MKEAGGQPQKRVNIQRPQAVLPNQDEWLLLAFVDQEDTLAFTEWWQAEGQRVFNSWKANQ